MNLPVYVVNAFVGPAEPFQSRRVKGNPAAVCPLDGWLPDDLLQAVAAENNLSETAFFVRQGDEFELRWFTPGVEIDLCGHATLAAASVILARPDLWPGLDRGVRFVSPISGPLPVRRVMRASEELLELDFPARPPQPCAPHADLIPALGSAVIDVLAAERDYLCILPAEEDVRDLRPDLGLLRRLDKEGVIVSARGQGSDMVCRYFAPRLGLDEDPVTGSAHCVITPYWARVLRQSGLTSRQLSARGGELFCEAKGARTAIAGRAALYLEGTLTL